MPASAIVRTPTTTFRVCLSSLDQALPAGIRAGQGGTLVRQRGEAVAQKALDPFAPGCMRRRCSGVFSNVRN